MAATLSLAEYSGPPWGQIDLTDDPDSQRRFWAALLQWAEAHRAAAISYNVARGDDCLAVRIGKKVVVLNPPPEEYREDILTTGRNLAANWPARLLAYCLGNAITGTIRIETPSTEREWIATCQPNAMMLKSLERYDVQTD